MYEEDSSTLWTGAAQVMGLRIESNFPIIIAISQSLTRM